MYYLKTELGNLGEIRIPIENIGQVYSFCPICDKEFSIDFEDFLELLKGKEFDLYGTQLFCKGCSDKRQVVNGGKNSER